MVVAEIPNALGRCDLVVDMPDATRIIEFKRDIDSDVALRQIAEKEYATPREDRLRLDVSPKSIETIAVTFGTRDRNIVAWDVR